MITIEGQTYYRVAKLVKSHGVKGEMKIEPLTPYFNLCDWSRDCWVSDRHSKLSLRTILSVRWNGHSGFVTLSGIRDRNDSDNMTGGYLLIEKSKLPVPQEGEYYVHDMIGMNVFTVNGSKIGILSDIREGPSYDWYEVTLDDSKDKKLIPAVSDFIESLDVAGKKLVIRETPGLLKETESGDNPGSVRKENRADD